MNVFLDDMRQPTHVGWSGDDWVIVRTAKECFELLKIGNVVDLSLDHDLGMEEENKLASTGYDLCKWMVEQNIWPSGQIYIHSSNPVGRNNMKQLIDRYRPSEIIYHDDL